MKEIVQRVNEIKTLYKNAEIILPEVLAEQTERTEKSDSVESVTDIEQAIEIESGIEVEQLTDENAENRPLEQEIVVAPNLFNISLSMVAQNPSDEESTEMPSQKETEIVKTEQPEQADDTHETEPEHIQDEHQTTEETQLEQPEHAVQTEQTEQKVVISQFEGQSIPPVEQRQEVKVSSNSNAGDLSQKFAEKLITNISSKIAVLPIADVVEDVKNIVAGMFSDSEISRLQHASTPVYTQTLMKKVAEISSNPEIKEIKRALSTAVLTDMDINNPKEAKEVLTSLPKSINIVMNELTKNRSYKGYKPDMNDIQNKYNENMELLSEQDKKSISDLIVKGFDMNSNEKADIDDLLSNRKKYLYQIINPIASKELKIMAVKMLMSDFDAKFGTNYSTEADNFFEKLEQKQLDEKLSILDKIDWDDSIF